MGLGILMSILLSIFWCKFKLICLKLVIDFFNILFFIKKGYYGFFKS